MRNAIFLLSVLFVTACTGEDGVDSLTDIQDEAAGANCAAGGLRISTGPDDNANGTLDAGEVAVTRYICSSASSLTNVVPEALGTNCSAGGVKIQSGLDNNRNGTLDSAEVTATNYVCGSGEAQIVKSFNGSALGFPAASGLEQTILDGQVTTTSGGELLAIASVDIYCTPAECPAGNPDASGYFWIANGANAVAPVADFDFFAIHQNETEGLTRTARFPIAAAGTHTFNVRGQDVVNAFTFYRPALTLVFLP